MSISIKVDGSVSPPRLFLTNPKIYLIMLLTDRPAVSASLPGWAILLVSLSLLSTPTASFAHGGHSHNDFRSGSETPPQSQPISVDSQTAQHLGLKVEPATAMRLATGIKTTGQIETLPNQKVEVRAPVDGTLVELLVKPGDRVSKNQPLAVLSSSELAQLRVESLSKEAEAQADLQQAQADLKLAQENYDRQVKIAEAEIAQAKTQLEAAQKLYGRDRQLVSQGSVLKVAQANYQQQLEIAKAEITKAETELKVAQEQYDRDRELVANGAIPRRTMLESQAHLAQAKADLAKAKSRQNVLAADTEVKQAEVDLPLRDLRESQGKVAEAEAQLTKALSRKEVLAAENQLKRAQAALAAAQSRVRLASVTYETRLQQLGTVANDKGLVTVVAPIAGTIADREITPGEAVNAAEKPLMTLVNDSRVFATANVYEKDLNQIQQGQEVRVKVASFPNRIFKGRISFIGSAVEGETRIVPVKAELDNDEGLLKPNMFAELEILTSRTATPVLAIPNSAVVAANGKQLVYIQNGDAFQAMEVGLGQTSGDLVEVKTGLFEGDLVVTQRAPQLYAQSLRGNNKKAAEKTENPVETGTRGQIPWWVSLPAGGAIATGAFWLGRRTQSQTKGAKDRETPAPVYDLEAYLHHHPQPAKLYSDREREEA